MPLIRWNLPLDGWKPHVLLLRSQRWSIFPRLYLVFLCPSSKVNFFIQSLMNANSRYSECRPLKGLLFLPWESNFQDCLYHWITASFAYIPYINVCTYLGMYPLPRKNLNLFSITVRSRAMRRCHSNPGFLSPIVTPHEINAYIIIAAYVHWDTRGLHACM